MTINPPKIVVIKSDVSQLKKVETFVNNIFTENNIAIKYFNKVYLCISEAVINAIEHGNRNDNSKKVSIKASFENKVLFFKIKDEGEGFNPEKVGDPTKFENIKKETGRGIYIIKTFSEGIKFNKKGNSIHLKIECR